MGVRAFHVVEIVAIHLIVLSLENLYLKSTARSPKKSSPVWVKINSMHEGKTLERSTVSNKSLLSKFELKMHLKRYFLNAV